MNINGWMEFEATYVLQKTVCQYIYAIYATSIYSSIGKIY